MSKSYKITGHEALRLAKRDNLTLRCHANPVDPEDREVTASEAEDILREDPSLIYVTVEPTGEWVGCDGTGYNVSDYFDGGRYRGADGDGAEPVWRDAGAEAMDDSSDGATTIYYVDRYRDGQAMDILGPYDSLASARDALEVGEEETRVKPYDGVIDELTERHPGSTVRLVESWDAECDSDCDSIYSVTIS